MEIPSEAVKNTLVYKEVGPRQVPSLTSMKEITGRKEGANELTLNPRGKHASTNLVGLPTKGRIQDKATGHLVTSKKR